MVGVNGEDVLPDQPTEARPGTEEKLKVFEQRAAQGVSLFHPADAMW